MKPIPICVEHRWSGVFQEGDEAMEMEAFYSKPEIQSDKAGDDNEEALGKVLAGGRREGNDVLHWDNTMEGAKRNHIVGRHCHGDRPEAAHVHVG